MNLPNKITIARVCLIPLFMIVLMCGANYEWPYYHIWSAIIFAIASMTDGIDGHIARSRGLVTDFGKFMDPLADKLLVGAALICLIETGQLPALVVIIIISREFIISGFRLIASDNGVVIAASYWGKFKTVSQMVMVIVLILNIPALALVGQILIWVSTILTVVSLVDYIVKNKEVLKDTK